MNPKIKKHSHLPVFIGIALIFIGFIALLSYENYRIAAEKSNLQVRLKWLHNAQFAGMYVADSTGIYEQNGINVILNEPKADGPTAVDSLLSGASDVIVISALELLENIAQNKPIIAIGAVYQESPAALGSLEESNIQKPADLRGKVLGTPKAAGFALVIPNALLEVGNTPTNTVSRKVIGFETIESLISGKVDVASFYRTEGYSPKNGPKITLNYIKPEDYGIHLYDDVIVTTHQHIKDNPELLQKFMNSTIKGWETALDNPSVGIEATLAKAQGKYSDQDYQQYILSVSEPLIRPKGGKGIGQMDSAHWSQIYKMYKKSVVSPDFDIQKAYTLDFLP